MLLLLMMMLLFGILSVAFFPLKQRSYRCETQA
jgi:hypothetical protein